MYRLLQEYPVNGNRSGLPPPRSRARLVRGWWPRASSGSRKPEALRTMEIDYGQGWLFGRPGEAWPADATPAPVPLCLGKASGRLERDLERACTARVASEAVVDHLARQGLLPSVFLAQAGRRRASQAARGRWQVHDGLSPAAGVVGRVFRTGESAVVEDIGDAPEYLPTVPGVRAEVCFALRAGDQIVGALDAESLTAIDAATVAEVERRAALLSARLEEVGALGPASPAQRLARISARLASSEDAEGVVREALAGAIELSGYESAVVALADGHGALYPHLAEGPYAVAFSQLEPQELAAMAVWVDEGTSSYTVGETAGRGFAGHEVLRRAGVGSLIVLPLVAAGERVGLVVIADRAARRPAFEDIELLELWRCRRPTVSGWRPCCPSFESRVTR